MHFRFMNTDNGGDHLSDGHEFLTLKVERDECHVKNDNVLSSVFAWSSFSARALTVSLFPFTTILYTFIVISF